LMEWFLQNDPPTDTAMDDGSVDTIHSAFVRLSDVLRGSSWAQYISQGEAPAPPHGSRPFSPVRENPSDWDELDRPGPEGSAFEHPSFISPPGRNAWDERDSERTPRRPGTPPGASSSFIPPPPPAGFRFGSLAFPAGSTVPQATQLGSPIRIRSGKRSGTSQKQPARDSARPAAPSGPEPMDLDRTSPAPPSAPIRPRSQPARPTVPYQRDHPIGLPSNPRDVRAKPKIARPFAVVAKKGKATVKSSSRTEALISLAKAMPNAAPASIVKALNTVDGPSASPKAKGPSFTAPGPSRKQALVEFNTTDGNPPVPDFQRMSTSVNTALERARSATRVLSGAIAYGGWALQTSTVPSDQDLDLIRGLVCAQYPAFAKKLWVGLPQSTSYLKVVDVPFYTDHTHNERTAPSHVAQTFQQSPLHEDYRLTSPVRIVRESHASTRATVYFNVWDSQSGARAKRLINKRINICGNECYIRAAAANPGVPMCQKCWKWGHPTKACKGRLRCPICGDPHTEAEHRHTAGCCKGNAGATPPVPPTPVGQACPHRFRCLSCRKDGHMATDRKCPFWGARFDRPKIEALYAKVRAFQKLGRRLANSTLA
jgi:hypothetical protein